MERIGPSGRVTSSTGNIDQNGDVVNELVGVVRECGTSFAPWPWTERPGFYDRIAGTGQDPDALRRMLATAGVAR